ncbi:type II toxin-antitoxin system toxin DNA ADP-ribosyl transferase DarT [Acinetobacter soli]
MTAIDNLSSIFDQKALICKNQLQGKNIRYGNIAHSSIQDRRSQKTVPLPPHGTLHDYVPFYFAPRSPMLYTINQGNVDECSYRQKDVIYLQTTVEKMVESEKVYLFTDRNASLEYALFERNYNELNSKLNWDYFTAAPTLDGYCKYFMTNSAYPERGEIRQAEFLIHESLTIEHIELIGVYDDDALKAVKTLLTAYNLCIPVSIKSDWYF